MHFEVLVEDQSGKRTLEILLPKILDSRNHTFRVIAYKGIGHLPKNLQGKSDPAKRVLLGRLPELLRGYGRTYAGFMDYAVVVVCDLDNRCLKEFRADLDRILDLCDPRPRAVFCIAIEEGEAWFLGDLPAILTAYPKAKDAIFRTYSNDSICGTWEKLADAVYPGGRKQLESQGRNTVGKLKFEWAEKIAPHMEIERNKSPSFQYLCRKLRDFL
jgi:hypothetical protein